MPGFIIGIVAFARQYALRDLLSLNALPILPVDVMCGPRHRSKPVALGDMIARLREWLDHSTLKLSPLFAEPCLVFSRSHTSL